MVDLNATQAAIRSGYSEKTAPEQGSRLLTNVNVQAYVQEKQAIVAEENNITIKRVLEEYAKIAFSDIRQFYNQDGALKPIHELSDEAAGSLAGVDAYEERSEGEVIGTVKKIKTYDKTKALDSLGRHLGLFEKDNEQANKSITVNIE